MTVDDETTRTQSCYSTEGWEELMGKDLLLKQQQTKNKSADTSDENKDAAIQGENEDGDDDGAGVVNNKDVASSIISIQPQDTVIVDFIGRSAATPADDDGVIFHRAANWMVVVGEKDVLPALEMGLRFLSSHTCVIWSHSKYAYGAMPGRKLLEQQGDNDDCLDNPDGGSWLPPFSNVRYEITLQTVIRAAEVTTPSFQLQLCQSKQNMANDIYNHEWLHGSELTVNTRSDAYCDDMSINDTTINGYAKQRILQLYKRAAELMEFVVQQQQQSEDATVVPNVALDLQPFRDCMLNCYNNIAAVHMRLHEYHACKDVCVTVLQRDPNNYRALIRAAKAALLDPASSYDEVDAAIQAAANTVASTTTTTCETSNPMKQRVSDIEKLRLDFRRRKQTYNRRRKAMYSKMGNATLNSIRKDEEKKDIRVVDDNKESSSVRDTITTSRRDPKATLGTVPVPVILLETTPETRFSWLQSVPWKEIIFIFGVQLVLPFLAYYCFKMRYYDKAKDPLQALRANSDIASA